MQGSFIMLADVFRPVEIQGQFNSMTQEWTMDSTVTCELMSVSVNSEMRFSLQVFDDFFSLPSIVYGRFSRDIRQCNDGKSYPVASLLVTNLRTNDINQNILFEEPYEDIMIPTVFEVRNLSPFIDPWGNIEYYKTQLMRAENQKVLYTP